MICRKHCNSILLALLVLTTTACAPQVERNRYFWPPGSDDPKLEYVNFYQTAEDARRGAESWLAEAVLGKNKPSRLFQKPHDIASDGKGRVWVSDTSLREVFVFDLKNYQVRKLQIPNRGQGPFLFPAGLAVDAVGNAFVSDSLDKKIHAFDSDEMYQGSFGSEYLNRPTGLAVDGGRSRIYVVDTGAHQVVFFDGAGRHLKTIGKRGSYPGEFNYPLDVEVDQEGNLYVLDAMNFRVQVFDSEGSFLRAFGEQGTASGSFKVAKALSVSPSGHVYVSDSMAHKVVVFDLQGQHLMTMGGQAMALDGQVSPGGFYLPSGVDVDANDAIWVVDSLNGMFHQFQYLNDRYLRQNPILPGQAAPVPVQ